jgi:tetratricopeptide (TPR) repeat protein
LKNAEKNYRRALSGDAFDCEIYNDLGFIDLAHGHTQQAESDYRMALKTNPHSAQAFYGLGLTDYLKGHTDLAVANFQNSMEANPLFMEPRSFMAYILTGRGDYDQAIRLCLKNLEIVDDDPKTLSLLMRIYTLRKDDYHLNHYASRYIAIESDPGLLTRLGIQMAQEIVPQVPLARECFEKALRAAPGYANAYLAQGALEVKLGHYQEAVRVFKAGLRLNPSDRRFEYGISKIMTLMSGTEKPSWTIKNL